MREPDDVLNSIECNYLVNPHHIMTQDPNFEHLHPNFGWIPTKAIKYTFNTTTRWAHAVEHIPFRKHFKS